MSSFLDAAVRELVSAAVDGGRIEWRRHALERMAKRNALSETVLRTIRDGLVVEDYPSSFPFPSALLLAWSNSRPLHVVAAFDVNSDKVYVVTVYEPDSMHFESDMRTRKRN